ncbi:hypothetical protein PVAP13_5NG509072 [Panicum virgatum]|uniref:Uncharacterized protein n=1 Tax=Panicum virgatum TaxID=38727 RepID=A0A8T0S5R5_PANVG|nr:hypothetical protein PVAP13_5NG509072 [Panicum virgatum]KAG2591869.1 hypothetical protein PVAP13_5NG509072 [Panicum virgatum]
MALASNNRNLARIHVALLKAIIQEHNDALLETTNEIQRMPKNEDSVHQMETHSGFLPAISDDVHFMEALKVQNCETPRSHQSSTVPDAMRCR